AARRQLRPAPRRRRLCAPDWPYRPGRRGRRSGVVRERRGTAADGRDRKAHEPQGGAENHPGLRARHAERASLPGGAAPAETAAKTTAAAAAATAAATPRASAASRPAAAPGSAATPGPAAAP